MLTVEQKKFILFCMENDFFTKKDAQQIQENMGKYPKASFGEVVAKSLSCSMAHIEKMRNAYIQQNDNAQSNTMPMYLLNDYKWAQEVFGRGIVDLKVLNRILQEKYQEGDERDFLQILLAKRAINTKNFLLVQKEINVEQWRDTPSELEIRMKGDSYFFERKSTAKTLGRYRIIRELGRGGMGVVYEGYDRELDRTVAIKTMISNLAGEEQKERFLREAKLIASLKHPGITQIYEIGVEDEVVFFAMDYIEGLSLIEYIKVMQLDVHEKIKLMAQVADALAFAHQQGVIHRDIKPDNVMIDSNGKPYLMDFGLAKRKGSEVLTMTGAAIGTPQYMSPEQVEGQKGKIKKTTDVFSFGIVLYEVLVGKPPFTAASIQAIFAAISVKDPVMPRKLVPDLPRDLETICMKCLEKSPAKRYPTARALHNDLQNFIHGGNIKAKPVGITAKTMRFVRRNKMVFSLACILVVSVTTLAYQFLFAPGTLYLKLKGDKQILTANIFIDDEFLPVQKSYSLASGYHEVTIKHPQYQTLRFSVKLAPGEERNIEKQLKRIQGKITLKSPISGIRVTCIHQETQEKFHFFAPVYEYELPKGDYECIFEKDNYFAQQRKLHIGPNRIVNVDIDLESMLVWKQDFAQKIHDIATADIDKDGRDELYVTRDEGSITSFDILSRQELWSFVSNLRSFGGIDFHDINHDGVLDIVYTHQNEFFILDGNTHNKIFTEPSWWGGRYGFYDENGDGYDDVILANHHRGIRCIDMKSGKDLWRRPMRNFKAASAQILDFITPTQILYPTTDYDFVLFDVKRKIQRPILKMQDASLVAFDEKHLFFSNRQTLSCIEKRKLSQKWAWKASSQHMIKIQVCDIDNDHREEVIVVADHLYCLDSEDGSLKWKSQQPCGFTTTFTPIVTDLNKDNNREIIVSGDNRVLIFNNRGAQISELKFASKLKKLKIADVSGDGFLEILCLLEKSILAMNPTKGLKKTYKNDLFLNARSLIPVDVNNDEVCDAIVANTLGEIYCLDGKNFQKIWQIKQPEETPIYLQNVTSRKQLIVNHREKISLYDLQGNLEKDLVLSPYNQGVNMQIVNLNNDEVPEIIYSLEGHIYCFSDGNLLWKKPFPLRHGLVDFVDVNNNGFKDVIVLSEIRDDLGYSFVVCFEGQSGSLLWKEETMYAGGKLLGPMVLQGSTGPLLFVTQHAGTVSHINFRNGKTIWQKQLTTGAIINHAQVGNFDGVAGDEIIVFGDDAEIVSLDVSTGKRNWIQFSEDGFSNRDFNTLVADIDKDGTLDVVTTINPAKFRVFNLKSGRHVSTVYGKTIKGTPHFIRSANDYNFFTVTTNSQVIHIKSFIKYLHASLKSNAIFPLKNGTIRSHTSEIDKAVHCIEQQQYTLALNYIKKYEQVYPKAFVGKFLHLVISLNRQSPNAQKLLAALISTSIWNFEITWQKYAALLDDQGNEHLRKILPSTIRKRGYHKKLVRAYENAIFMNNPQEQQRLLAMSLKYGSSSDPGYENRRQLYLQYVRNEIARNFTLYRRHKGFRIIEKAFTVLHNDKDLHLEKIYLCIDRRNYEEAMIAIHKLLRKNPKNLTAHIAFTICKILQKNYAQALDFLQKNKQSFIGKQQTKSIYLFLTLLAKRDKKSAVQVWKQHLEHLGPQDLWKYSLRYLIYR
ncbi:protein kinase domain-containing protein [Candidatus Uabimicrobium amorphum]|uniref:non-specific serine/threonine protein kinase n=1 Tax=Uabimicrobium amorphum TaxID=2596890 RepID=A0A5S9IJK2_UABAM|nr:serine/threonine-protein kinase [Candidatus Uabimicrobium amorphum]BBM82727.1 protein kinase [Candidatus Uabimicrobium amorphum]